VVSLSAGRIAEDDPTDLGQEAVRPMLACVATGRAAGHSVKAARFFSVDFKPAA
jgi:hypothetical protein